MDPPDMSSLAALVASLYDDDDDDDDMIPSRDLPLPEDCTIGELVKERQWERIKERLSKEPSLSLWTDENNSRTALHYLFRLKFPHSISGYDDDDDDSDDESRDAEKLKKETEEEIKKATEIAKLLISLSHSSPPVLLPQDIYDDDCDDDDSVTASYALHHSCLTIKDYLGNTPLHTLISVGFPNISFVKALFEANVLVDSGVGENSEDITGNNCGQQEREKEEEKDVNHQEIEEQHQNKEKVKNQGQDEQQQKKKEELSSLKTFMQQLDRKNGQRKLPTPSDLVSIKNMHGCTPLHFLAEGRLDYEVSEYILRESCSPINSNRYTINPLLISDEDGDLPLHYLCSSGLDNSWIELFLKYSGNDDGKHNKDVHTQNLEGSLPVDDLIVWYLDCVDDFAGAFMGEEEDMNNEEDQEKKEEEKKDAMESFKQKWSGLWPQLNVFLRAATNSSSFHINATNEETKTTTFLPIHAAASIPWFPSLILRLAAALYPDQISCKDVHGMLPLHIACMDNCNYTHPVCKGSDNTSHRIGNNSYFNNHDDHGPHTMFAIQRIDTYPELARWGMMSSCCCETTYDDFDYGESDMMTSLPSSSSMIQFLLGIYPKAGKVHIPVFHDNVWSNTKTRLPLHLALEGRRASLEDIRALLRAYPDALTTKDGATGLYPFMIAAAAATAETAQSISTEKGDHDEEEDEDSEFVYEEDIKLDMCFELLRLDPELVRSGAIIKNDSRDEGS